MSSVLKGFSCLAEGKVPVRLKEDMPLLDNDEEGNVVVGEEERLRLEETLLASSALGGSMSRVEVSMADSMMVLKAGFEVERVHLSCKGESNERSSRTPAPVLS